MITKEDLKQEIERLDSGYLELVFNLLKQFPHQSKPDPLSCSRPIEYTGNDDTINDLAFTDIVDAASYGKQLRTDSWQRSKDFRFLPNIELCSSFV